jgi:hypothetical protein
MEITKARCFDVDSLLKIPHFNLTRIDAPGALHHIVIQEIDSKAIFEGDKDREAFLEKLSRLLQEMDADTLRRLRPIRAERCRLPLS